MTYLTTFLTCRLVERGVIGGKKPQRKEKVRATMGMGFLFLTSREKVVRKGPDRDLPSCAVKEVPFNLRRLVYQKEKASD